MPRKKVIGTALGLTEPEKTRLNLQPYVDDIHDFTILRLLRDTDILGYMARIVDARGAECEL